MKVILDWQSAGVFNLNIKKVNVMQRLLWKCFEDVLITISASVIDGFNEQFFWQPDRTKFKFFRQFFYDQ